MLILIISNILFLTRNIDRSQQLGNSKEYFEQQSKQLPPMSFEEKCSLLMFLIAAVLSFTRKLYQNIFPGLKPAYVFIFCAMLSFLITGKDGKRLMAWKQVQSKIVWELMYVFAGGLAAGTLINQSGAAQSVGMAVAKLGLNGGLLTVFTIVLITIILSDITSNTATAAVAIPIVISITQGIGVNPIPYIYIATVGVNLSYMLPTSIRAIPVGYGLKPKYMFKEGWKLTALVIILMTAVGYVLLKYWPMFSAT